MKKNASHIPEKIFWGVERLATFFRARLRDEAERLNMTPLQAQILLLIHAHRDGKKHSVTSLALEYDVSKATISEAVSALQRKGWVKKEVTAEDSRSFYLSATASGKKITEKLEKIKNAFSGCFDDVPSLEMDSIWFGLLRLIRHLQSEDKIPVRMCLSCQHFDETGGGGGQPFCRLMQAVLQVKDLRIDCPEHALVE